MLRSENDPWQLARHQVHRRGFLAAQGDMLGAIVAVREAEGVFRERQLDSGICISVINSAAYLLALGRLEDAWERAREGLDAASRVGGSTYAAMAIGHLAEIAANCGEIHQAARLLGWAVVVYSTTGGAREPTEQRGYERAVRISIGVWRCKAW